MLISFKFGKKMVYFQQALLGVGDERVEEDMLQDGLTPFWETEKVFFLYFLVSTCIGRFFGFETCAEGCFDPVGEGGRPLLFTRPSIVSKSRTALLRVHYETSIEGLGTTFVCLLRPQKPLNVWHSSAFQLPPCRRTCDTYTIRKMDLRSH